MKGNIETPGGGLKIRTPSCIAGPLKNSPGGHFWGAIHFPIGPPRYILQVFCKVFIKATLVGMFFVYN